jgi:hypothetical protein
MHKGIKYLYYLAAIAALAACKKGFEGAEKANTAPETYVVADTIVRQGDNRFTSQVEIKWWGTDGDGYIDGYEYRINDSAWKFTRRQDSTFLLIIPGNLDTFDFKFEVRAIDEKGLADPTPARIFYPVKNTSPTVNFYTPTAIPSRNPTRSFPALRFYWRADDLDGIASLDSFEICLNDTTGPKVKIPPAFRDLLLLGKDFSGTTTDCDIYLGSNQNISGITLSGLILDDSNTLFIRAIDKVGAASSFAASNKILVRKPKGKILLVNAIESQFQRATIQNFYTTAFEAVNNKDYDIMLATELVANNYSELSPDPFTQTQVFGFFDRIFWFSDNTDFSMSLLQKSSGLFFSNGGRILMVSAANDNIPEAPLYLDFTPISKFLPVTNNDAFLMQQNDSLIPVSGPWPILTTPNFLTGIRPFELPLDNNDFAYLPLYNGIITREMNSTISRWTGISTLAAKRVRKSDNNTNFIISVVPMHRFNAQNNFNAFLNEAVNTELEF